MREWRTPHAARRENEKQHDSMKGAACMADGAARKAGRQPPCAEERGARVYGQWGVLRQPRANTYWTGSHRMRTTARGGTWAVVGSGPCC